MQLKQPKSPKYSYLLAFALPVVSMMILQIIAGCEPFSNQRSMLYSDMYHQYYPFFVEFRRALRSGDSLLYNWSVGMGMDYLSLISYYLASPLNLISVLLPESWMLEFFSLLMPIKLGLASLFFAIFLHRIFGDTDYSIALFGAFYGLCAWALGYQWNIMWLDTFALLPLMALGTVSLLRDRKFILYTLVLFLSIYANYYIGLFTCIFVLLLFFVWEICRWQGLRRFFQDFGRIAFFTVIGIGMTAILELPAIAGLQNTQSSVNNFPTSFRLNIAKENTIRGLFDAMRQVAGNTLGGLTPTFKEGLPNVYCGVGSLVLAFLFLTARDVRLRDKICSVGLLVFFTLSFIIRQLDYLWHGMHFTNMIPYRFSFLFCFVVLYMAYSAWRMRDRFNRWNLCFAGFGVILLILLSNGWRDLLKESGEKTDAWLFLAYNVGFLVLYLGALFYRLPRRLRNGESESRQDRERLLARRELSSLLLVGILVLELGLNVLNFGLRFSYTTVTNYPKGTTDTETVLEYMKAREIDTPFYRAETTHTQTLNEGALNGFHGVGTFTSSANVRTTEFMKALGYGAKNTYNRYAFEESSPVSNLFLGLKYMIERDGQVEENDYFDLVFSSGSVSLLENNAYLPLGFLTQPQLAELNFTVNDYFQFQNELFSAATGVLADVWQEELQFEITGDKVPIKTQAGNKVTYDKAESGGSITYTFRVGHSGFLCLDFDVTDRNKYEVFLNGEKLYSETLSLRQMIAACNVVPGDEISVKLKCKAAEDGHMTIRAAVLDGSLFRTGVELLQESPLNLTSFSNTDVRGTIDAAHDGLLYTSVPQDGNWRVYVDGVQVQETLVGDCMIGVMLEEGPHDIRLSYHNTAFSYGWKISLACVLVLGMSTMIYGRRRPGKYEAK